MNLGAAGSACVDVLGEITHRVLSELKLCLVAAALRRCSVSGLFHSCMVSTAMRCRNHNNISGPDRYGQVRQAVHRRRKASLPIMSAAVCKGLTSNLRWSLQGCRFIVLIILLAPVL